VCIENIVGGGIVLSHRAGGRRAQALFLRVAARHRPRLPTLVVRQQQQQQQQQKEQRQVAKKGADEPQAAGSPWSSGCAVRGRAGQSRARANAGQRRDERGRADELGGLFVCLLARECLQGLGKRREICHGVERRRIQAAGVEGMAPGPVHCKSSSSHSPSSAFTEPESSSLLSTNGRESKMASSVPRSPTPGEELK